MDNKHDDFTVNSQEIFKNIQQSVEEITKLHENTIKQNLDEIRNLNKIIIEKFNKIKDILNRHYPTTPDGLENDKFDDEYRSEQAIDDIYDVVYPVSERLY
jgi:ABC-type Zn uptake system ZnuABC Zn-binding protein ZnuA